MSGRMIIFMVLAIIMAFWCGFLVYRFLVEKTTPLFFLIVCFFSAAFFAFGATAFTNPEIGLVSDLDAKSMFRLDGQVQTLEGKKIAVLENATGKVYCVIIPEPLPSDVSFFKIRNEKLVPADTPSGKIENEKQTK